MLPIMRYRNSQKEYSITVFGGINTSYDTVINQPVEAVNMTSAEFPAISSGKGLAKVSSASGVICCAGFFDKLYTIERTDGDKGVFCLCADGTATEFASFESSSEADTVHSMEFMKDAIYIMPENIIYHVDDGSFKKCTALESTTEESCQTKFCNESLTDEDMPMPYNTWYSGYLTSNSIVSMTKNYQVNSTGYDFYHLGVSSDFEEGDIVTIKMEVKPIDEEKDSEYKAYVKKMAEGVVLKIKSLKKTSHKTPSGTISEYTSLIFDDNAIDMGGYGEVFVLDISIEKTVPEFRDMCSFENRMWAVTSNELCSSRLGDPSVWDDFSVDSYGTLPSSSFRTEVESDGVFTAVEAYNGNILAFKEDCIYKVYGNEPAEYRLTRINCPGVKVGCHKSAVTVNGVIYYMGQDGIYGFNGTSVSLVSKNISLDGLTLKCASGDERYYLAQFEAPSGQIVYIYDTMHQTWHKATCPDNITDLVRTNTVIAYVCKDSVMMCDESGPDYWSFALAIGKKEFSSKHICRIMLRYTLPDNNSFAVRLTNKHATCTLAEISGKAVNKIRSIAIPVSCDEDALLTFEGKGRFTLTSLTIRYKETGIND